MVHAHNHFNAHANESRVNTMIDSRRSGHMAAPAILAKDEAAYSIAMERAAMNKRNVKVTLKTLPWE